MTGARKAMVVNMGGDDVGFSPELVALTLVRRLQAVLKAENSEIRRSEIVRYKEHAREKQQLLLELTRLSPALANWTVGAPFANEFREVADLLEVNADLLRLQLRAARHVGDIIARAIIDGQSDGTYTARDWRA
jgi:flagellar biosynthesis/type III secretory pathway chaperone